MNKIYIHLMTVFYDIQPLFNKNMKDASINKTKKIHINNPIDLNSYFISNNYVPIINQFFTNKETITYNNGRNTILINLFTTTNKEYNIWNNNDYDILYLNVIMMLSLMDYVKTTNNKVIIHFYPTKFKKEWNERNLTPEVINSGFTSHGKDKYILIYRKEEYNRLLLHELIHYLLLDSAMDNKIWSSTHMKISLDYNIFNHINLFETYTDTWAIILLIIMTHIIEPKLSLKSLLKKEKEHILCMVQQLLYQLSIPDIDSISIHTWVQHTSALSYYVFKYGTLNMDDFITKYPIGIKFTKEKADELYSDIRKELNGKFIEMKNNCKSAKLSYLGYDV
jgi:hypothetical protein